MISESVAGAPTISGSVVRTARLDLAPIIVIDRLGARLFGQRAAHDRALYEIAECSHRRREFIVQVHGVTFPAVTRLDEPLGTVHRAARVTRRERPVADAIELGAELGEHLGSQRKCYQPAIVFVAIEVGGFT